MSVAVRYLQTWKRALQGWKLAEAICEAAGLANMRFVAKKAVGQQAILVVHTGYARVCEGENVRRATRYAACCQNLAS